MIVDAIGPLSGDIAAGNAITPAATSRVDFASLAGAGLARVDGELQTAESLLRGLAAGQAIPVHEVMVAMERARLDLTLAAEIRNRLLDAYQELTRMQL